MDADGQAAAPHLIPLCLALAAGAAGVHALPELPSLPTLLLGALPAFLPWRGRAVYAAGLLGVLAAWWQASAYLDTRWPASRHGETLELSGHVSSLPEWAPGFDGRERSTLRFEFEPLDRASPRRIRVSWYEAERPVRGGECWTLSLKLRTPRGSQNPGSFDYEGWLYRRGIGATASVRDGRPCEQPRAMPVLALRQRLVDHLEQHLAPGRGAAMVAALTLGHDAGFSDADWTVFRRTGTSHLVAISGFNVAILAGLAFLLVRWSWPLSRRLAHRLPAQKAGMIAAALAGLGYGLMAGWESPAQRAALMLALLLLAALPDRVGSPWRALAAALALMLTFDPAAVLSPGLWLSFGAVAAIFYVVGGRLRAPPAWRALIELQVMLSLMLAPLTLHFFQGAAWLGIPVNLVAVPLMTLLTPLVLTCVALGALLPGIGVPLLTGVTALLGMLLDGLGWISANAPLAWLPASPSLPALLLALFGLVLLFAPRGLPLRPLGLACCLPLLVPAPQGLRGTFEVQVLDVGQGLAVLVHTRRHTLLYDAGPAFGGGFDAGDAVVVPSLLASGRRRIDHLVLSHGDRDHAGGLAAVTSLLPVGRQTGTPDGAPCRDGQAWTWDAVRFEVLHPGSEASSSDNNGSCVLRISDGRFHVLLTGDIEVEAEQRLLQVHRAQLRADVLLVPHHGSRTSSGAAFVDAVGPGLVVYPAGWRSHYGHPHPAVVARYREADARALITGVEGALRVWQDAEGQIQVERWRERSRRFWHAAAEP